MDVKISLPLLPLRDIVVFPSMVIPLFVGRDKSISALNEVMKKDKKIILVTQKNSEIDDPKKTDVFMYGCEGNILQLLKLPDGTVKVLVEGIKRVKILDFKDNDKFIVCEYTPHNDVGDYVVVINAEKIKVTGNKNEQKMYYRHTGYPGGIKSQNFNDLIASYPDRIITSAVKGMLPKNKLSNSVIKKLKVYKGESHPHSAQNPVKLEI